MTQGVLIIAGKPGTMLPVLLIQLRSKIIPRFRLANQALVATSVLVTITPFYLFPSSTAAIWIDFETPKSGTEIQIF